MSYIDGMAIKLIGTVERMTTDSEESILSVLCSPKLRAHLDTLDEIIPQTSIAPNGCRINLPSILPYVSSLICGGCINTFDGIVIAAIEQVQKQNVLYGANSVQKLLDAYIRGARNFSGSNISGIDLRESYLRGVNFSHSNLSSACLLDCDLRGANLSGCNLKNAELSWSDLRYVDFSDADLSEAWLTGSDLRGAKFQGACLLNSEMTGVDLVNANLDGAYTIGAIFHAVRWYIHQQKPSGSVNFFDC